MVKVTFERHEGVLNAIVSAEEAVFTDCFFRFGGQDKPARLTDPAYKGGGYRKVVLQIIGNGPDDLARLTEAAWAVARAASERERDLRQLDKELADRAFTIE